MDIEQQRAAAARGEAMFFTSIGSGNVKGNGQPRSADRIAQLEKIRAAKAAKAKAAEQAAEKPAE